MHELFALELDDAERWRRVGVLLPMLLDDPELRASAKDWPTTQYANAATNLLFYEDPECKFVINGLVKDPHAATPIHDHAHTWTAYGVIEGSERVLRYTIAEGDGERAVLAPAGEYTVAPGYVDVVPPHEPHAGLRARAGRWPSSCAANASAAFRRTCTIWPAAASSGDRDQRQFPTRSKAARSNSGGSTILRSWSLACSHAYVSRTVSASDGM